MKITILLLLVHTAMSAFANVYLPAENESGEIVELFSNGELKIKGDESGQYYYVSHKEVLNHVNRSQGYTKDLPIKYIFSSIYYYGHVTQVFEADDKTVIKVYFESDDSIMYLDLADFTGHYSHLLTTGCMSSYRGAEIGSELENEDGERTIKYLFKDGTTVLEETYFGGRSFYLTSLDDLGFTAEEECK